MAYSGVYIKVSGTARNASRTYIKVGGTVKAATYDYMKVGGTVKTVSCYTYSSCYCYGDCYDCSDSCDSCSSYGCVGWSPCGGSYRDECSPDSGCNDGGCSTYGCPMDCGAYICALEDGNAANC